MNVKNVPLDTTRMMLESVKKSVLIVLNLQQMVFVLDAMLDIELKILFVLRIKLQMETQIALNGEINYV